LKFPGRFRGGYVINSNILLKALMQFVRAIYKAKVVDRSDSTTVLLRYFNIILRGLRCRIKPVHKAELLDFIPLENLPTDYGGQWTVDIKKDWMEGFAERYRPKGPVNAWK
jgi:hypothetical protein